jgi:hypothetical protein
MNIELETFFNYHALRGGKLITIWCNGENHCLTKSELAKVKAPFTLTTSDTKYHISGKGKKLIVTDIQP